MLTKEQVRQLIDAWLHRSRKQLECADSEPVEKATSGDVMRHGAACYFNAASELEALMAMGIPWEAVGGTEPKQ